MQAPVQIHIFFCFLFSVTFVQCQECLREGITYENITPVEKASYDDGETVKLNCMTGYFGFYKLKCNKGQWQTFIARSCSKKKCGHPGETPNGYFKLIEGKDYVYGATVEYTCKKGYEMASRNNRRHCRIKGWDNSIPVCEEVRCPVIHTDGTVTALGNTVEGAYGDVIHFQCVSSNKSLYGNNIIHCMENGNWSGPVPQCIDGTCQEQELKKVKILFGYPTFTSPYEPGHVLVFQCTDDNMRFYGHRAIECQPDGKWNYPYPQCGGQTCPPPPYIKNGDYSTISKTADNVITAVSYTCQSFFVLDKQQENYKCVNGIWETPPKCLKPCEIDKIVEKYNLQLPKEKVYIKHADTYRLNCTDGWNTGSEMKAYVDVSCSNGNLQFDQSCDTQNKLK
ncbi:complement factor H like 3 isoform X1 [Danio rerio]|uniref:Complement factor H like 3 isoform X1 n=1 Tax=Danio rerio TaxID=7955 RepID=A0AC58IDP4_DANRE